MVTTLKAVYNTTLATPVAGVSVAIPELYIASGWKVAPNDSLFVESCRVQCQLGDSMIYDNGTELPSIELDAVGAGSIVGPCGIVIGEWTDVAKYLFPTSLVAPVSLRMKPNKFRFRYDALNLSFADVACKFSFEMIVRHNKEFTV